MWLRTREGCTLMGWMSPTVSTAIPFFSSNSLISSFSARMHTTNSKKIYSQAMNHKKCITLKDALLANIICLKKKTWLALDNHIRLGDGGESAVEWVYLSRSQEALKIILVDQNFNTDSHKARSWSLRCGSVPLPLPRDCPEYTVTGPTSEGTCP